MAVTRMRHCHREHLQQKICNLKKTLEATAEFFEKGEQGAAYSVPLHSAAAPKPLGDGSEGKLVQEFDSSENLQEIMGCWWQAYTEDRVVGRCGGRSHFNRVHRTEKRHERHASHCKSACVAGSSETRPRTRLKKRGRKSPIQCSCVENGSLGISRLQVGATPDKKQRW